MRQRRGMRPAASPKTVELITSMANMPHLVKLSDIASDQTSKISGLPATDVERSWKTSTPSSCTGGEGISVAAARDLTPSSVLHEGGSESAEAQGSDACSSKVHRNSNQAHMAGNCIGSDCILPSLASVIFLCCRLCPRVSV